MPKGTTTLRSRLALAAISGVLVAIASLFWIDSPPRLFAQTDTTAPSVSSVAVTSDTGDDEVYLDDDGVYGIGDKIEVTVTFSEDVTVIGSPQLELDIGGSASSAAYKSTTGSKVIFSYTVAAGDSDTDGISIAADKLSLNGGSIKDGADNDADLSHSALSAQSGHKVDGIRPTITSVGLSGSSSNQDSVHTIDEYLPADVRFSEHVYVGGHPGPRLRLNFEGTTRSADFAGAFPQCNEPICVYGPGARYGISLGFGYMIAKGDLDLDGAAIDANSLVLNGGSIRDGAGNDAVLTHSAIAEDSYYIVDGVPATVRSVAITSNPGSDNTYGVGDTIEVTATFSESVSVPRWIGSDENGRSVVRMPRLELTIGGQTKTAKTHERESITGTAVAFSYTVQDGDNDADGISVGASKLSLNGGSIRDANGTCCPGGNSADLTHSAVADDSGHKVATSAPPKSADATLSALTLSGIDIGTFASSTTSYTAQVANSVSQTTVGLTVNHSGASYVIKIGGVTDSDGTVSLSVGNNVITVEVTAEDGNTTQTYTVNVTRAEPPSTDATLSALTLSGIDIGTFASGTISYTAQVANSVSETTVSATVNHSGASYVAKLGGVEDDDGVISLAEGGNVITVEVTAEDGDITKTYTVTVTRLVSSLSTEASSDATLSGLNLSGIDFGTFESGTESYTAEVANSVSETTVTPSLNDSGASYVIKLGGVTDEDGTISLAVGSNVITVEVTAEDDSTTKTYTVTVTRISAPDLAVTFVYTFTNPFGYSPSFTLGVTVSNKGSSSSGSTTLRYYRSADSTVTSGDTEVGTDDVKSLTASGSSRESIDLTAPSAPGTYYYGACVDAVADESDTTNNCSPSVAFTVPAETSTDATLSALTLSGIDFGTFDSATISYSAQVSNSVTETTVTPTVNHSGASHVIKLGGVTNADGTVSLAVGSNVITIEVTAEDGETTRTYTVTVTRAAPPLNDATLKALTLSGMDFGTFEPGTTSYTAEVAKSVTETTVTPTVNNSNASYVIKLGGVTDPDGVIALSVGSNVITIEVTAEDDSATQTYTVTIIRAEPPSTDATLRALTLSGVDFGTFASGTTSYSAQAANSVTQTTVTPTVNDSGASHVIKLGGVTDADGVIALSVGNNVITIEVTAEDASTARTYTVTVTRAAPPSTDATLKGLTLSGVDFGTFDPTTVSYNASVANSVTETTVTPTLNDSGASYVIKLGGVTDEDGTISLAVGSNVITVEVTAEDDSTTKTYTVTVTGAATSISAPDLAVPFLITLTNLYVYDPSFTLGVTVSNKGSGSSGSTTLRYYRSADSTITSGDTEVGTDAVESLAASGSSRQSIDLTAPSAPGTYYYGACVDAVADESDTTNNCSPSVAFTVPAETSTDATLSALTLSGIDFGTFDLATMSYSAQVSNSVTETTVTPTVNHSGASYVIKLGGVTDADGTISLAVGSNVITIEVTAEDGETTRTYTVTVTRAAPPSTDATLNGLTLSGVNFGTFGSGTTSYTAQVAYSVSETTVTLTVNDSGASHVVKLGGVEDADGDVSLGVGSNVIIVEVTAEDDDTTQTYTVTVTRGAPSTDATLSTLTLSGIDFGTFASGTITYSAQAANSVTQTTVTPTVNDSGSSHVIKLGGVTDADGVIALSVGNNVITIKVTAEDDSTARTYTVTVTRSAPTSTDATLKGLTLGGVDFGTFDPTTVSYTAEVANSVSETTVTPVVNDSGTRNVIKLGGVEDADGDVSLAVGSNVITVKVTAEDDSTTRTYTVTVTRAPPPSTDATLSALTLSGVDFGAFASGTTSYTAQAANSLTQTTVTPTVNDSGASQVIKLGGVTDADGVVLLRVGSNVITVEVTAEDDSTTRTYTVTVTRAEPLTPELSSDATLSALALSGVDFGTFDSTTVSYTALVANGVSQTSVTPTVNDSGASYVIKLGGVEYADGEISLAVGSNVITVEVTAEDDSTTRTYTITVTRAEPPSTDATLSALTLSGVDFGTFTSGTTSYSAQVANSVSETTVTPTVNDSGATHVIKLGGVTDVDGVVVLSVGSNVITVEVTAEDDSATRTYTITVTRDEPASTDASLSALGLSGIDFGTFDSTTTSYNVQVANSVTETTVTPTVNDSEASYVIKLNGTSDSDGVIPLSEGSNVLTIEVTSENGDVSRVYTVEVTRSEPGGPGPSVQGLEDRYDANDNGTIEKNEVIEAINDYLFGEGAEAISKAEVIELINLYLFG